MSAIKIEVKSEGYGHSIGRTAIYVDGKFAYQSGNAVSVEHDNLAKLIKLIPIENTYIVSVYTNDKEDNNVNTHNKS